MPDNSTIPQHLTSIPRWAPWCAVWNKKRGKYDKIPHRADKPDYGISTAKPEQWASFDNALKVVKSNPDKFAGVGFCITGQTDLVMIDLDDCIVNGELKPWARDVVSQVNSYTEVSPSGAGLRIVVSGSVPTDWVNHDVGIEVYAGHQSRFLTITGNLLQGAPVTVNTAPDGVLEDLASRYARGRTTTQTIVASDMPDLIDELMLPAVAELPISDAARAFLEYGATGDDRSGTLHATGIALYAAGLDDDAVFSILATNEYAMEVALDHRRQDSDRALLYLWREHCVKAKAKARALVASPDEFEAIPESDGVERSKFEVIPAVEFANGTPPRWVVRDVLPEACLCVVYGESGSGKSFFVLDLVAAVARGIEWRGKRTKQGKVVYVAAEGAGGFRKRLSAYAQHNNIDLASLPLGVIAAAPNLLAHDDVALANAIEAAGGASVIVIDTLAQSTPGGNENSSEDMGLATARCQRLHTATGALVVLVHHSGKDSSKGARGWSGLRAAVDAELEVSRQGEYRQVKTTKQKDGDDDSIFPFRLEVVEVGQDEEGFAVTSCVMDYENVVMPTTPAKPRGKWESLVMEVVSEIALGQNSGIEIDVVISEAANRAEAPEKGKRDTRKQLAKRALLALCEGDDAPFFLENDTITVL